MNKRLLGYGTLLLMLLTAVAGCARAPSTLRGGMMEPPRAAGNIELADSAGTVFRLDAHKGKIVMVYFGYTHCPDVCPLTLSDLNQAMGKLGSAAERVQVVFITVDPERDSPEVMTRYARAFNPSFVGLSGTPEQTASLAKAYGVTYKKTTLPNSALGYAMDHSAFIYVIDAQGRLRELLPFGTQIEDIVHDVQQLIQEGA